MHRAALPRHYRGTLRHAAAATTRKSGAARKIPAAGRRDLIFALRSPCRGGRGGGGARALQHFARGAIRLYNAATRARRGGAGRRGTRDHLDAGRVFPRSNLRERAHSTRTPCPSRRRFESASSSGCSGGMQSFFFLSLPPTTLFFDRRRPCRCCDLSRASRSRRAHREQSVEPLENNGCADALPPPQHQAHRSQSEPRTRPEVTGSGSAERADAPSEERGRE